MDDKEKTALTAGVIGGILIVPVIACAIFLEAYAVSKLWLWFVVPLGVKSIGMAHAFGITFIAHVLMGPKRGKDDREAHVVLITEFSVPLLALLFGYIASLFL